MSRRFQFSLRALLVLMFGAACFFGGIAIGLRQQETLLQAERAATNEVIGKLLQSHNGSMRAAERRIVELQKAERK